MKVKIIFTTVFAFLANMIGVLAFPVIVLVSINLLDYITGLIAAPFRQEKISSYKSFRGIAKKISQWILVFIGVAVDWLLSYSGLHINIFISAMVCVWLICNEIISILENIADIGTPLPPFLIKIVKYIKGNTEKTAELPETEVKHNAN